MAGATGGGERVRTYRGSLVSMILLALLCAVFGGLFAFFGLLLVIGAGAPAAVAIPFCAAALGLFLLTYCVVRGVTIVDDTGLTLRWLRTRRFAWRDLVAVELEHNAPASAERKRPVMGVVVYHRDGRRLTLPNVIDTRSLLAHREAQAIREVWERHRGADWTPRPEVTTPARAKADASERNENSLVEAMGYGWTAVRVLAGCVLIVAVAFLATGNAGSFPDVPGPVIAGVFAVVAVTPVAIALAGMARRRRARRPGEEGDEPPPW
ncbi:hypothetical protein [Streptomyces sp. B8F3]|uniref:hypothetical protein n=1 Tax=unclassified Streptomyces TaxID=2593676 RepID=UPI00325F8D8E